MESKLLDRTIEVKTNNRPVKIAYLIPCGDTEKNHLILDAIFHESYSRWGGGKTLLIPIKNNSFLNESYKQWLEFYDPDFVYSYVEIKEEFDAIIKRICNPIEIIEHSFRDECQRWYAYIPRYSLYIDPVSSITVVCNSNPIILTHEGNSATEERKITDNFGSSCYIDKPLYKKEGCFEIQDVNNFEEALEVASEKNKRTISSLSILLSEAVPKIEDYRYRAFHIIIGNSYSDRIAFWNIRNLSPDWYGMPTSIILNADFFEDEVLVKKLGTFLRNKNYISYSNGPNIVHLRSLSLEKEKLKGFQEKLKKVYSDSVELNENFNAEIIPEIKSFKENSYSFRPDDEKYFTLFETENQNLRAEEPAYFSTISSQNFCLKKGQWMIDTMIERHKTLPICVGINNIWKMPRRGSVVKCFTGCLGKINKFYTLSLIPSKGASGVFGFGSLKQNLVYDLRLPSDERVFDNLIRRRRQGEITEDKCYIDGIKLSDKGENLRGIISMFDSVNTAYKILTNKFWRTVLREKYTQTKRICSEDEIRGELASIEFLKKITKDLNITSKYTHGYMECVLKDCLEFLVRNNIFYQVFEKRCSYCGYHNILSIDSLRSKNVCDICGTDFFMPLDIGDMSKKSKKENQWKFKINNFVYDSLITRNGLAVLWTIGYLQDRDPRNVFYYLPEVNLYENYNSEPSGEVDILCVMDGKFCIAEVQKYVNGYQEKEKNKFLEKIKLIKPDKIILSFEKYCENRVDQKENKEDVKRIRNNFSELIKRGIEIEILVAEDLDEDYREYPTELGFYGGRRALLLNNINEEK